MVMNMAVVKNACSSTVIVSVYSVCEVLSAQPEVPCLFYGGHRIQVRAISSGVHVAQPGGHVSVCASHQHSCEQYS